MKRTAIFALLLTSTVFMGSCVKKCKLRDKSEDSGTIVKDVIIYPKGGYMTSSMGGNYLINGSSSYANDFEVSFDGGYTRESVNYSVYNILANPMNIECDASYNRSVTVDDVNHVVTYNIDATQCSTTCDEVRTIENYVLVTAIPSGYTVNYTNTISNK